MSLKNVVNKAVGALKKLKSPSEAPKSCPTWDLEPKYNEPEEYSEKKLLWMRNVSRLRDGDRRVLHGQKRYDESQTWFHDTIRYKKRLLGKYGIQSANCNLGIAWPSKEELADKAEWEKVAYPMTIQEGWKAIAEEHTRAKAEIMERQEAIDVTVAKFHKWKTDLDAKIKVKEEKLALATKKNQERLQQARDHFGFNISKYDVRFKEFIAEKQAEEKKLMVTAKKQLKAEKLIARLATKETQMPKTADKV